MGPSEALPGPSEAAPDHSGVPLEGSAPGPAVEVLREACHGSLWARCHADVAEGAGSVGCLHEAEWGRVAACLHAVVVEWEGVADSLSGNL